MSTRGYQPGASILDRAGAIVEGPRQEKYGPPQLNHTRTALMWEAYLTAREISPKVGQPLDAEDVCWLNILQKIARELHSPTVDGLTDVPGYALNIELVRGNGGQDGFREATRSYYEREDRA